MTEKEIVRLLQGTWKCENDLPSFKIVNKKVYISGDIVGIGIPGFDNTVAKPLILQWDEEFGKWQIFIEELDWVLTFIEEITDSYFIINHFELDQNKFSEPTKVNRI